MQGLPWGGSEELWSRAALRLLAAGDEVCVSFGSREAVPRILDRIQRAGGELHWRSKWSQKIERQLAKYTRIRPNRWLDGHRPNFVVITQAMHVDDLAIAHACQQRRIPYLINVQCASDSYWVESSKMDRYAEAYRHAEMVCFLSRDNQRIVESNLGETLENAHIVDNPFGVPRDVSLDWPVDAGEWRVACVGRLNNESKGFDLAVEVLGWPKWRARNLRLSFWGQDHGSAGQIQAAIARRQLRHVELAGFADDVQHIWASHHALLLPSRYEGLPMVTVEAMLSGRIGIVTTCGRNAELIDDGATGFHIAAPSARFLDVALERAWSCRDRWQRMGLVAARRVRERYSQDPVGDFVERLRRTQREQGLQQAA